MENDFKSVNNFEEIILSAQQIINATPDHYQINFSLKVQFGIDLIKTPQLHDVVTEAEAWQNTTKPEHLHINHGIYIGENGIDHVIDELIHKRPSNRALISLISQKDIVGSGDTPIPSFMLIQFSLEGSDLYVTTYFRALEVSKFLRINIEEIRLIIKKIYDQIPTISSIRMNIFAFRAYINENQSTLKRQKIDMLPGHHILRFMEDSPKRIVTLLKEKLEESTAIENSALRYIHEVINDQVVNEKIHSCFKGELTKRLLAVCLATSEELINLRKKTSHSERISELNKAYLKSLDGLIGEIEKCL